MLTFCPVTQLTGPHPILAQNSNPVGLGPGQRSLNKPVPPGYFSVRQHTYCVSEGEV